MAEGEQADENADTVMRPDSDDTAVVADTPPTLAAEALAWSAAEPPDVESQADRRPLLTALIFLLAGVCVGGVTLAAFMVGRHHQDRQTAVLSPGNASATASNPAMTQPPSTAATSPPAATTGSVRADPIREKNFIAALTNAVDLGAPYHISYADIPGSHGAYMGDPTAWLPGGTVVSNGYRACAVLAGYPNDHGRATDVFYRELGFRTDVDVSTEQARTTYIEIVAVDLCT